VRDCDEKEGPAMIKEAIKTDINFISRHTLQPKWWKIAKVFILAAVLVALYLILGAVKTAVWLAIVILLSLIVHFTYRIKTHTYTKSWIDFSVKEVEGKLVYERIGLLYYSLVAAILLIATITVILI
jgi:hypothetical protein